MREIKFRAWDNDKKILCSVTDINFSDYSANGVCFGDWSKFSINKLMQYTERKDDNQKEIYDGDILTNDLNELFTVYFDSGSFFIHSVTDETDYRDIALYMCKTLGKVVGNIYENPELLS